MGEKHTGEAQVSATPREAVEGKQQLPASGTKGVHHYAYLQSAFVHDKGGLKARHNSPCPAPFNLSPQEAEKGRLL